MADPRFVRLEQHVRGSFDNSDPSHDYEHVKRVVAMAGALAAKEGANLEVVLPAALLHDIVNVPKNSPDRAKASAQAAEHARGILARFDYSEPEIEAIAVAIVEHSYSRGLTPSSVESACVQDADRLEALGALGIMRTVSCGARMGARYYDPAEPTALARALDDKANTLDHLHVKLYKLAALMNTRAARAEAVRRTEFMRRFEAQLLAEIAVASSGVLA